MMKAGKPHRIRFKVVEVDGRVRIQCDSPPDMDERIILKGNGFRMVGHDPMVWSRFLTESAGRAAERACKALNM